MFSRTLLCLAVLVAVATAFSSVEPPSRARSTYTPMKRVGLATPPPSFNRGRCNNQNGLCMSAEEDAAALRAQAKKLRQEAADAAGVPVEELSAVIQNTDGTVYDDEELEPIRENVSSAMKDRLRREASAGLDSEKGNTNVILYISVAIVILVAAAGQGILY